MYSEQQKDLAGKDGEGAFKKVFEVESKLVVVLYRSEWGTTAWTRIEQTGIRDRAYQDGYEFVTFVAMEDKPKMPDWFPKQRLYASHPRFGIDSVVAVIDARAQEAQIPSREMSVDEIAVEFEQLRQFEAARQAYLYSHQGGTDIQNFFAELHSLLRAQFAELAKSVPSLRIGDRSNGTQLGITSEGPSLMVSYRQPYINTLDGSELRIEFYNGGPPLTGLHYYDEQPQKYKSFKMTADRTLEMPLCWHYEDRAYDNADAANLIIKLWLEHQPSGRKRT